MYQTMPTMNRLIFQGLTEPSTGGSPSPGDSSSVYAGERKEEEATNLVIDTKLESEPEDLPSQADSDESEKKGHTEIASKSENYNCEPATADSTKPLFSKSNFPTLTPLPTPLALTLPPSSPLPLGLNMDTALALSSSSHTKRSSPTR